MIDWGRVDELREEVGADDLAEVVEMFCEEVDEVLRGLSSTTSSELPGKIHFLKGSAQNIGFVGLAELCLSTENALRGNPASTPDIKCLSEVFAAARNTLFKSWVWINWEEPPFPAAIHC